MSDLKERLKESAAAFRQHPIYTLDGEAVYLTVQADELDEALARIEQLEAALTPSAETKAAYMGEFRFIFGEYTPNVPWITIKEIMAAIRAYAAALPSRKAP